MARKLTLNAALVCHKGCERDNNEDNFFFNGDYMPLERMNYGAQISHAFDDPGQLYAVFDGMGGTTLGERAAYLAAKQMQALYGNMNPAGFSQAIEKYATDASDLVHEDAKKNKSRAQGTTMALLAILKQTIYVANVGDSRVYRLRKGELSQLSRDHSEVNRMRAAGILTEEEARKAVRSNIITQYIGMSAAERSEGFLHMGKHSFAAGDRYLLCTDGVSDLINNTQIAQMMRNAKTASDAARMLVWYALEMGGKDNTTALVVDA